MGTQVDDLQIKIVAEAKSAENAIDKLISKLGVLEQKIGAFGKIKKLDIGVSKASNISSAIEKEMSKANESVSKQSSKMSSTVAEHIAKLRQEFGSLGKDFDKMGGFANIKTPEAAQKAIDNAKVKVAKAYEAASKSGFGTKGFDSAIKTVITYENHIESLQQKLDALNAERASSSIERYNNSVANIEAALARMRAENEGVTESIHQEETAQRNFNNAVSESPIAQKAQDAQAATESMSESAESASKQYSMIGATIDAFRKQLNNAPRLFETLNLTKPKEEFLDIQDHIEKTENKLINLEAMMERGLATNKNFSKTTTYKKIQYDIDEARNALQSFEAELDEMGNHTHQINWGAIGSRMKESFGTALGIVKRLTSHVFNLANALNKKIVSSFANFTKNLNKTDDVAKKLFKSFTKVGRMLRLMITRMALRGVISEAKQSFTELTQFSDKVADNFNKLRNAIKYLADTLAALVAPIFKTSSSFAGIGYIIDAITDKIVDLINKFNQLLSALLGHSTWIKATKQTKDYTKEVDKAGKAAKKALQPFDELNNLTTNDSGSGNDNGTGGSQFSELPIDKKWKDIAKWLKEMWKKADFTELGALLGAKLRDALNSIPWGKIQNTARKLASSLATLLNGFFRTEGLAKSIGNTLAQAINTGLIFAEEFIKKFDFAAFGKFIGDAIVTAIKNIHWQRFVDACGNLGKGIATAINSLVGTGVISEIGKAIGKVVLAAVNFAFNLVTNINFEELANEIANGIKNFLLVLNDVDKETGLTGWEKLGKTISDGLLGILKILNTTLGDKDIRAELSKGITDMLNQIDFATIIGQSAELIKNIAIGFANVIIAAFKSEEFRKGIAAAIPYLGLAFTAVLAGKGLAAAGSAIAKNLLHYIGLSIASGQFFSNIGNAFLKLGASTFGKVGEGAISVVGKVGSAISTALSGIGGEIAIACTALVSGVVAFFAGADIGNTIGKYLYPNDKELYEKYDGIKGTINLTLEAIVTFYQRAYERISGWISKWAEYQRNSLSEAKTFIQNTARGIYTAVTGVFTSLGQFFSELPKKAMTWGGNFITGLINGMQQKFSGVTSLVSNVVSRLRQNSNGGIFVNGQWKPIQGYASGGVPKSAEMFLARENGAPELVGKMGSHTAVANNDQIVASVADGVYRAVVSAMAASGGNNKVQIELIPDKDNLFKVIRKEGNDYQKRTGNPVFA